jgi:hypothetical protein
VPCKFPSGNEFHLPTPDISPHNPAQIDMGLHQAWVHRSREMTEIYRQQLKYSIAPALFLTILICYTINFNDFLLYFC